MHSVRNMEGKRKLNFQLLLLKILALNQLRTPLVSNELIENSQKFLYFGLSLGLYSLKEEEEWLGINWKQTIRDNGVKVIQSQTIWRVNYQIGKCRGKILNVEYLECICLKSPYYLILLHCMKAIVDRLQWPIVFCLYSSHSVPSKT